MNEQIFIQKRLQCWYCPGEMIYRIFETCFGETLHYYECVQCHFTLDTDFVAKFGPERPTAA